MNHLTGNQRTVKRLMFLTLFMSLIWMTLAQAANNDEDDEFDHSLTGFMLTGQHSVLSCDSCHIRGIFRGIPKTCEGCHEQVSQIAASIKPITHVQTSASCDDCHTDSSWTLVRMDHSELTGSCYSCHNGVRATGKPLNHIQSSNECDDCHLSIAWVPARFDHSDITLSCITCHNGTTATGKNPAHILSGNACDDCHSTNAWTPARFDHSNITVSCITCHNGTTATGKTPSHIPSGEACDDCHSTSAWSPANFDHDNITSGCNTCHNGVIATGKGQGHFVTSLQCDTCHSTNFWEPALEFDHQSANYPGDHTGSNPDCNDCHTSNSQTISWRFATYAPECAACHADDYDQGEHDNAPISGLIDCASSSCHEDIPRHNVNQSTWD
ncbi:MAG: hypothetical protein OQL06_07510 [Gammaproteobacteria bacterium]|nr:hypothetical protein [Gammaproteobacteria bacterium]